MMENSRPKVTIAVSVYNVAQYVEQAMNCIVNQSLRDIEILCIDDASTDGTYDILAGFAQKDPRVRLLRMEKNEGLSVSRNKALKMAAGDYIMLVDGDDLMDPELAEKAYGKAVETQADLVLWDYCVFYDEGSIAQMKKQPSDLGAIAAEDKIALLRRPAFAWVRLFKRDAISALGIHFPEGLTKQDIPVHWLAITRLERIALLPDRLSYYRQQPNSTSNNRDTSLFSLAYVMDIVGEQLRKDGLFELYRNEYFRQQLNLLHGMYDFIKKEYRPQALAIINDRITEAHEAYILSKECGMRYRARLFYLSCGGNLTARLKLNALNCCRSVYRMLKAQR